MLPGPPCAERRICRCSSACVARRPNRSSILAHQLRLPLPWTASPAPWICIPKTGPLPSSTALLGESAHCVLLCPPHPRGNALVPHRARDRNLFRRLFPAGPEDHPKVVDIAGRRRSVLLSLPPRRVPPERVSWLRRLGRPPRSPLESGPFCRVAKAESDASGLWITWISRISRGESRPGPSRAGTLKRAHAFSHHHPPCKE